MRERLRVLLVDDEPLAITRLRVLLQRHEDVEVVGEARDGEAALQLAGDLSPDLCLLDIAMPGMDGVALARALGASTTPPRVVFVTAYDNFAVAAFDVEAIDYLVKPVTPTRLERALVRARERPASALAGASAGRLTEFWASDPKGLTRIATCDIDRITAERDYVRLHMGGRSWLVNDSLMRLEARLDPAEFVRLHRGAIVRRSFVAGFRHDEGGWTARLADGSEQKVGRSYAENARRLSGRGRQR